MSISRRHFMQGVLGGGYSSATGVKLPAMPSDKVPSILTTDFIPAKIITCYIMLYRFLGKIRDKLAYGPWIAHRERPIHIIPKNRPVTFDDYFEKVELTQIDWTQWNINIYVWDDECMYKQRRYGFVGFLDCYNKQGFNIELGACMDCLLTDLPDNFDQERWLKVVREETESLVKRFQDAKL